MGSLGFDIDDTEDSGIPQPMIPRPETSFLNIPLVLPSPGFWHPRMAFDVALGVEDEETIRDRYDLTPTAFSHIITQPSFRAELATHYSVLRETGATFAVKAKLIAEEKLEDMYKIISDAMVDPKVRMETWKAVTKAAGLEERVDKGIVANGQTVNIQINY